MFVNVPYVISDREDLRLRAGVIQTYSFAPNIFSPDESYESFAQSHASISRSQPDLANLLLPFVIVAKLTGSPKGLDCAGINALRDTENLPLMERSQLRNQLCDNYAKMALTGFNKDLRGVEVFVPSRKLFSVYFGLE